MTGTPSEVITLEVIEEDTVVKDNGSTTTPVKTGDSARPMGYVLVIAMTKRLPHDRIYREAIFG